jgi:CheY-like chemotaxis protein
MLAQSECPDLIILDVEMPGMNGYELCHRLKEYSCITEAPIIFVSARDKIEERLKGYEAGAEDYIIKPFEPQELNAKVTQLLKAVSERARLKEMASYATSTAMTAMTSMSEMGSLLESLKNFNASNDEEALAKAILSGFPAYGLTGVVQIRTPENSISLTEQGEASQMEVLVINHMAGMDRIVHFKKRLSIHYPHVSILIRNMPQEDADRCGRLRDHLATLVEGAEMRAAGIVAENESRKRGAAIEKAATSITKMLAEVDHAQRQSRISTSMAINDFTGDMEKAYIRVALSDTHEKFMADVVKDGMEKILNSQLAEVDIQNNLTNIIKELKVLAGIDKK